MSKDVLLGLLPRDAVPMDQVEQVVEGALGPHPLAFLAADAVFTVDGMVVSGAEPVAEVLRELTAAADTIQIEIDGQHATATWPMVAEGDDLWVVFRFEVCNGFVRSVRAEPQR